MRALPWRLLPVLGVLLGCGGAPVHNPLANPAAGPPAGHAAGTCAIPPEAAPVDTSSPTRVVGTGTPESCTGDAFIA